MIKPAEKTELNQVSLTGVRAIALIGLLIEAPRSLDEIKNAFVKLNILEPEHSYDILRIDLNTLRAMGCEITRACAKTNYKYKLIRHPFSLNITKDEVAVIKRAYKKIKSDANIKVILEYEKLFKKISEYVYDLDLKEALCGISVLKNFDVNFITELEEDCANKKTIKLIYNSISINSETEKEVIAQKLVLQNDKIYLYGFDLGIKKQVVLNVKRIKSIISRCVTKKNVEIETVNVKFFLKNFGVIDIEENEKIVETTKEGYLVEGQYYNNFLAIQRMLSFGSNCTVLEPENLKNEIIQRLKNIRNIYNG